MNCRQVVELMTEYLEGTLPEAERKRFEDHLAGCEGCREYLAQLKKTIELSGRAAAEPLPPGLERQLTDAFRDWKRDRRP